MSTSRRCEVYKATDNQWYMILGNFEHAQDNDNCSFYGPFACQDDVDRFLYHGPFSNPGAMEIDNSGTQAPPEQPTLQNRF